MQVGTESTLRFGVGWRQWNCLTVALGIRNAAGWRAGVTAGGLKKANLMWAAAGKAVSKLTAPVIGDPVASLETRLLARHGDSGSGGFLLQREVLFYKVVLGGSLISTCVREHGCRPSEHQNVFLLFV